MKLRKAAKLEPEQQAELKEAIAKYEQGNDMLRAFGFSGGSVRPRCAPWRGTPST